MKRFCLALFLGALCLATSAGASDLQWGGGDLSFNFSSNPYHQREPTVTQGELTILDNVVKMIQEERMEDAIAEIKLQLSRKPSAALWFSLAQLQQRQNSDQQAINALRKSLERLPDFTRAHEALGMLLTQAGEYTDARPHLQKAASHGGRAEIYAMLGYGYLQSKQPQAAQAAYSHALMLSGENAQWQRGLLYSALAAGDDALARSMINQLLADNSGDAQLYRLRASLAQRQQHWPEVIASLEIAQQLKPEAGLRWQLAQIYLEQGYFDLAQPHLRHLLVNDIRGRQTRLLEMADYLIARHRLKQADEILDKLLSADLLTDNEHSQALTSKAKLTRINRSSSSVTSQTALLNKALDLNPANGQALIALAELYEHNRVDQAEILYQRAAVLPEVRLEALQRHAQLLLTQEAYARAELMMEQAVKYAPENKLLRDNLALVSRMVKSQG